MSTQGHKALALYVHCAHPMAAMKGSLYREYGVYTAGYVVEQHYRAAWCPAVIMPSYMY